MEVIDYAKMVVNFNGKSYQFKIVVDENEGIEHIISLADLQSQLFDTNGNYISKQAECIDEQITYYVETVADLNRSDKELLEEIYD